MKFYRVANWSKDYENNRSREIKSAGWVPVPNGFDGDGYINLVDGPDGPLAYAGWICILLVASRCEVRGDLIQTTGKPHTPASIASKCRLPVGCIAIAIERTLANEWLLLVDESGVARPVPHAADGLVVTPPHPPAEMCDSFRENGKEQKGTEKTQTLAGGREGGAGGAHSIQRIEAMLGRDISSSDRLTIMRAEDKYAAMHPTTIGGQSVSMAELFDRCVGVAIAEPSFEWRSASACVRYIASIVERCSRDGCWPEDRPQAARIDDKPDTSAMDAGMADGLRRAEERKRKAQEAGR